MNAVVATGIALLATAMFGSAARAEPWQTTPADPNYGAGRSNQLALDAAARPHIAYWAVMSGVRHAWFDGSGWQNELVESPLPGPAISFDRASGPDGIQLLIGVSVSAAVDGVTPMLAYAKANYLGHTPVFGPVRFGVRGPGGWVMETVSPVGQHPEVAVGPDGVAHLLFFAEGRLLHAVRGAGGWTTDTVAATPTSWTSLRVDGAGVPHVAYRQDDALLYARLTPQGWSSEPVATGGSGPSLALDASGRPRIAYLCGVAPDIRIDYAERGSSGWVSQPVTPVGTQYSHPCLALDADDRSRIAYSTGLELGHDLLYAYRDGGPWVTEQVDTSGNGGQPVSLAIDPLGQPWLSYHHPAGDFLVAATRPGPVGVESPVAAPRLALRIAGALPMRLGAPLTLSIASPDAQRAALEIYDAAGRRIARRPAEDWAAGTRVLTWPAPFRSPGLYLVRVVTDGGDHAVARVVVLE